MRELNIEEQLPLLRTHDLDIAIFRSHTPPQQWKSFELPSEQLCVVLPVGHALASRASVHWSDLASERFVMADRRARC